MTRKPAGDEEIRDFFISYNHNDTAWAEWIAWQLEEAGHTVFLQAWDFRPGMSFPAKMLQGSERSRRTLAVLSPNFFSSGFAAAEMEAAFIQDPRGTEGTLLPVKIEACEIPRLFARLVYINLVNLDEATAAETLLTGVVLGRAKPEKKPGFPKTKKRRIQTQPRFPGTLPDIWNAPARNRNFSGRTGLLDDLHQALSSGKPTALTQAIKGLGGVGKTQLAIEYAYRHLADYDLIWWIHAEEKSKLAADYAELATKLDLPEKDAQKQQDIIDAVRLWLGQNAKWLLVFDNVTKPEDLDGYLPQGATGNVIITSRHVDWSALASPVSVEVMEKTEAVEFLLKRSGQDDRQTAEKLAEELDRLPLAIEEAGAYIRAKSTSLSDYLKLFKTRREELMKRGKPPGNYSYTVLTTWETSFAEVEKESPAAAELLNLCAFFAPDSIPLDDIRKGAKHLPDTLAVALKDDLCFNEIIAVLLRFSLVTRSGDSLSIHRLVQVVIQDRLPEDEKNKWVASAIEIINDVFPSKGYNDPRCWPECARLLAHAEVATDWDERMENAADATATLINNIGLYTLGCAQFSEAKKLFERALIIEEKAYGPDHPAVATIVNNLGSVLEDLGNLPGAKEHFERALIIDEKVYGPDHPAVAIRLNNLGLVLRELGDLPGAKEHFERALKIVKKIYGPDHPAVAIRLNNLGLVLKDLGDLSGAKEHFERALVIKEETFGKDHPNVAPAVNSLGVVLSDIGHLEEAKQHHERALEINKRALGSNHPKVATDFHNLGSVLQALGDLRGAKKHYERALKIDETVYGPDHPEVATDVNNLALVLRELGDLPGAKAHFERALDILLEFLGDDHPDTKKARENLEILEQEMKKKPAKKKQTKKKRPKK